MKKTVISKPSDASEGTAHYVYIARCRDGSLYTGTCIDLEKREALHNAGKASKYTRSRLPLHFIYHEEHATLSAARVREAALKKLSREEKLTLMADRDRGSS